MYVFLFPIHRNLNDGLAPYQATRRAWKVNEGFCNLPDAKAVGIASFEGQCVFNIDDWQVDNVEPHLKQFNGTPCCPELLNYNWRQIIEPAAGFFRFGNYLIVEFNDNGQYRFLRPNRLDLWYDLA